MSWLNVFLILSLNSIPGLTASRNSDTEKIMKGETRESIDDRFMLALWKSVPGRLKHSKYICAASAISVRHALTACHCVISSMSTPENLHGLLPAIPEDRRVLVAGYNLDMPIPGPSEHGHVAKERSTYQTREVFFGTPYYRCRQRTWLWDHDIGVLTVSIDFLVDQFHTFTLMPTFSSALNENLRKYQEFYNVNHTCDVYGWGSLRYLYNEGSNVTTYMNTVDQVLVNWTTCMRFCGSGLWGQLCRDPETAPDKLDQGRKLCAYRKFGRVGGPCYGDSGALLLCPEIPTGTLYAVAVLAAGLHCGQFYGGPFFYYKITSYWNLLRGFDSRFVMRWPWSGDKLTSTLSAEPLVPCYVTVPPGRIEIECDRDAREKDHEAKSATTENSLISSLALVTCTTIGTLRIIKDVMTF